MTLELASVIISTIIGIFQIVLSVRQSKIEKEIKKFNLEIGKIQTIQAEINSTKVGGGIIGNSNNGDISNNTMNF